MNEGKFNELEKLILDAFEITKRTDLDTLLKVIYANCKKRSTSDSSFVLETPDPISIFETMEKLENQGIVLRGEGDFWLNSEAIDG